MNTHFIPAEVGCKVNWIALDKNGCCYGYEERPRTRADNTWRGSGTSFLYWGRKPRNWKTELYTWSCL